MVKKFCEVFVVGDSKYVKLKLKIYVEEFASSVNKFEKRHRGGVPRYCCTIFGTPYYFWNTLLDVARAGQTLVRAIPNNGKWSEAFGIRIFVRGI